MERIWTKHKQLNTTLKPKVFVGLSGGVDSAVSAALLKQKRCDVTGVFIKIWSPEWTRCAMKEDRLDAMRVCAALDIPFREIDLTEEYKKTVVDYMIAEYKAGRTPNPDVMCNKTIKFGAFFDWAIENSADFVATGHYARVKEVKNQKSKVKNTGQNSKVFNYQLLAGKDKNKDQSYFLWNLTQKRLAKTIFPVGDLEKSGVRKLAKKFHLPTAEKKDSQGLCFVGKLDMKDFLKEYVEAKRGNVFDETGKIIGYHDGAVFYTIGERHGFHISQKSKVKSQKNQKQESPRYVVAKDVVKNTITVSTEKRGEFLPCAEKEMRIEKTNWISGNLPASGTKLLCRTRYREQLKQCEIIRASENAAITGFNEPVIAAAGQSLVLYDDEIVIGGGMIESV